MKDYIGIPFPGDPELISPDTAACAHDSTYAWSAKLISNITPRTLVKTVVKFLASATAWLTHYQHREQQNTTKEGTINNSAKVEAVHENWNVL